MSVKAEEEDIDTMPSIVPDMAFLSGVIDGPESEDEVMIMEVRTLYISL